MPARNASGGAGSKHAGIARAGAWSHTVTVPAGGSYRAVLESAQTEPAPRLLRVRASRAVSVFVQETFPLSTRARRYQLGGDSAIPNNPQGGTTYALGGINVKVWGSVEVRAAAINGQATVKAELLPCLGDETDTPPLEAVVELTDALETYTWVVDTATNDAEYGLDLTPPDGSSAADVTITADASATKDEIADAMAAAWNADSDAALWYTATSDGVDTVTFLSTGRLGGALITEDESAALTTLTAGTVVNGDPGPWVDVGKAPEGADEAQVDTIGLVELRLVDDAGSPATVAQWRTGPAPRSFVHGPLYKLQARNPGGFTFPTGTRKAHFTWRKG